ncbi:MAG TPA: FAD-binding oxidoreductase [Rhizomicrobium sp.]|jgi:alkyldihydroxyacetonephosphate synthase|nr:FAD-binding oxidoreductase [Rhizomicrobium sp.]
MTETATLSRRRKLRFYGWGYADEALSPEEESRTRDLIKRFGSTVEIAPPRETEFELRSPRVTVPQALAPLVSTTPYDRLVHSYGKSYADIVRMFMRDVPQPPDLVAFPKSESDIVAILEWASRANVAVIPFGGGSSVAGGVEPDVGDSYAGTVSLDLQYLNRVLEIDRASRAAKIQAGALGPELEDQLRPHGLTLRHFPQSLQLSTLGGWIATRSGGHYASLYTHIDDFVESTRLVTPAGTLETRRLPGSGAGPSPDRLVIGSEGILGVIVDAWMRLQDRPVHQASASVSFAKMTNAVAAVRALSQSALFPTNCRLLDPAEARNNGVGHGTSAVLVLGFESADHPLGPWMARALELVGDHGGQVDAEAVARSLAPAGGAQEHRKGAAGQWRNAFIRMPYYRDHMVARGVITDTFETSITWDRFENLYEGVREKTHAAIREICGHDAGISCRFTHIYPDGPAPYFSYSALGSANGKLADALARWRDIKRATNEIVVSLGGTVTHHHAVGRDHRSGYEMQSPPLFRAALSSAKKTLDPAGILNPGVLIDPVDRKVGIRGALG